MKNDQKKAIKTQVDLKKRKQSIFLKICIFLIVLLCMLLLIYKKHIDEKTMGYRISVSGVNISKLPLEEATEKVLDKFNKTTVVFSEQESEAYKATLKEIGYILDKKYLQQELSNIKKKRMENKRFIQKKEDFQIKYRIDRDQELEKGVLVESNFKIAEERKASVDAYIKYDEQKGEFVVMAEEQGNQVDEAQLSTYLEEVLKESFEQKLVKDSVKVEIGEHVYQKAAVQAEGSELNDQLQGLNQQLEQYRNTSVTYTLGETEEVLDSETIRSWIVINDNEISINDEEVKEFISQLGIKYNTIYNKRFFKNSYGDEIEISGNEYGYRIDRDAEFAQLIEDLKSGTAVSREPEYSKHGLSRNGKDDLQGSYIEVTIDNQHLWLYKDGVLVTETDVVTGLPTEEKETYRGAWPIVYKKSPYTLTSDFYGYEVDVTYWMPFVYGQGLHDANWQTSYGGDVYKTKGSHGCINLPPDQAKIIYDSISDGYPIIIY